jgi:hypothetical protein
MSNGSGTGPHERAQQALENASAHLSSWVDGMQQVADDWSAICTEALQNRSYPPERWLPDALALSINAWTAWWSCCGSPQPGTITIIQAPAPIDPTLVFDVKSEMAGPILVSAAAGATTVLGVTDLTNPGGTVIPATKVFVRLGAAGAVISLVDIQAIAPGEYEGTVTFGFTGGAAPLTLPLKAVCKDELFWIGGPVSSPTPEPEP